MPNSTSTSRAALPSSVPAVIWGDFTLTEDDVAELRSALRMDCPETPDFTDDAVRQMGYDTIQFVALILTLKKNRAE